MCKYVLEEECAVQRLRPEDDGLCKARSCSVTETSRRERFQILALDGGGYKGMFAATVLACLEADLQIKVADHFDLVPGTRRVGSSRWGWVLACGRSRSLTSTCARRVDFPAESRQATHLAARYDSDGLAAALSDVFGEKKLGERLVRLAISAYDLTNDDVYVSDTACGFPATGPS